jgi:hypothetical protein
MDPYLEARNIWPGFHHALAEEIRARLNEHIGPKYYADVEVYTTYEEIGIATTSTIVPDVGVFEPTPQTPGVATATPEVAIAPAPVRRLAQATQTKLRSVRVYVTGTDELVTAIELLSPYNKRAEGLDEYRRKRAKLLTSSVHLVEIDLLRGGQRPGYEVANPPLEEADYVLLVNRCREQEPQRISEIWPAPLDKALPGLPIPLSAPDPDVGLDLNAAIHAVYARAGYAWRISYQQPVPPPPLRPEMAAWLEQRLSALQ